MDPQMPVASEQVAPAALRLKPQCCPELFGLVMRLEAHSIFLRLLTDDTGICSSNFITACFKSPKVTDFPSDGILP